MNSSSRWRPAESIPVAHPGDEHIHVLREIVAFMSGNQSVSLLGASRSGKTTVLRGLLARALPAGIALGDDHLLVYLDCLTLNAGTAGEIFERLATAVQHALVERALPAEPSLQVAVEQRSRLAFDSAIRRLHQRGLRVVFLLDDVEHLCANRQLDVSFFNALRSLAGRYRLVFVTASTRPLIDLTWTDRSSELLSSPFFNIFATMYLEPPA